MLTQKEIATKGGIYPVMPQTKIDAFLREFPWVKGYIQGPLRRVYVSRVEPMILNKTPEGIDAGWMLPHQYLEQILLLDENGNIVFGEDPVRRLKYLIFGPRVVTGKTKKMTGEVRWTIGSTLRDLGDKAKSIRFVFSYYEYTGAAIVYKTPKGISLPDWIERQIKEERSEFQKACDEIDAETPVD